MFYSIQIIYSYKFPQPRHFFVSRKRRLVRRKGQSSACFRRSSMCEAPNHQFWSEIVQVPSPNYSGINDRRPRMANCLEMPRHRGVKDKGGEMYGKGGRLNLYRERKDTELANRGLWAPWMCRKEKKASRHNSEEVGMQARQRCHPCELVEMQEQKKEVCENA